MELVFLVLDLEEKHVVDVMIQMDIVSDLGGIKWKKKKMEKKKEDEVYGNAIQVFQVSNCRHLIVFSHSVLFLIHDESQTFGCKLIRF